MKGIILYKEYVEKELTNYVLTHVERTSTHNVEMPQHIIDMYLCKDGKTIHNSSEYEWSQDGDNSMNATFRNRDLRLLETVAPPYKVIPSADNTSWSIPPILKTVSLWISWALPVTQASGVEMGKPVNIKCSH